MTEVTRARGMEAFSMPITERPEWKVSVNSELLTEALPRTRNGKLAGRVALITNGDTELGREMAVAFARAGADVAITHNGNHREAQVTKYHVEREGKRCLAVAGCVGDEQFCSQALRNTIGVLGHVDIVINIALMESASDALKQSDVGRSKDTFGIGIRSVFYLAKAALEHLEPGSVIINTLQPIVDAGRAGVLDYVTTMGAIRRLTRELSGVLADEGIRMNVVDPGLQEAESNLVKAFTQAMGVLPMPEFESAVDLEQATPSYVFLASDEAAHLTGQMLDLGSRALAPLPPA